MCTGDTSARADVATNYINKRKSYIAFVIISHFNWARFLVFTALDSKVENCVFMSLLPTNIDTRYELCVFRLATQFDVTENKLIIDQ